MANGKIKYFEKLVLMGNLKEAATKYWESDNQDKLDKILNKQGLYNALIAETFNSIPGNRFMLY
jgi:hypothetical protein